MKSLERPFPSASTTQTNPESKGQPTNSAQELSIQVNGKEASEMALENRPGLTELSTLESGGRTELMAKVDSST